MCTRVLGLADYSKSDCEYSKSGATVTVEAEQYLVCARDDVAVQTQEEGILVEAAAKTAGVDTGKSGSRGQV